MKLTKWEVVLLVLLVVATIAMRLPFTAQTDFDSYWIHAMAESIDIYGYAQWVYHPASLFGYYPLSYPSGVMFFLAQFSVMTGLDMNMSLLITSLLFGILATLFVFVLGRKLGGFYVGFLAALFFSLSPQIIYYSSWTGSGRFFAIFFYMALLLCLLHMMHNLGLGFNHDLALSKDKFFWNRERNLLVAFKYACFVVLLFIFLFLIHRTAQLTVIFLAAAFGTCCLYLVVPMWRKISRLKPFAYLKKRYSGWNKWVIIDGVVVLIILAVLKFLDLLFRGRLWINITRLWDKVFARFVRVGELYISNPLVFWLGVLVLVVVAILLGWLAYKKRKWLIEQANVVYDYLYVDVQKQHQRYMFRALLVLAFVLFFAQFFGLSFYSPSLESYESSVILEGENAFVIFVNMLLNYATSVTLFIGFGVFGIIHLFWKRRKEPMDVFMIFITLAFIGILVDKQYVRLFVTPLLAIICAYGLIQLYRWCLPRISTKYIYTVLILLLILGFAGAFFPQVRESLTGNTSAFEFEKEYWDTGLYIGSLDCECSTVTTKELSAGVTIFASSGVPGGTHNIYYYVNQSYLEPEAVNWSDNWDNLINGRKVTRLWILPDWIFGGQFYHGRHTRILFDQTYRNEEAKKIVADYREEYYIHDKQLEENKFYDSIVPVFNKVYDNSLTNVHDLTKGRLG